MLKILTLAVLLVPIGVISRDSPAGSTDAAPTFYRDVLPILQRHCQVCHRAGEIGPMPLITYEDTKPWAKSIAQRTRTRNMPPWFADPGFGKFSNDVSLSSAEIETLTR